MAGRLSRRAALGAAAAACLGSVLSACRRGVGRGKTAAGEVLPVPVSGVVHLVFQPNVQGIPWNLTTQTIYQEFVDQHFNTNPKFKGIWASVFSGGWGNPQPQIAATIAGSGYADIFMMCCTAIPTLEQAGVVVPLDGLLKVDNIPATLWSKGHILADSYGGHLYGLPSYDGTLVIFYRQDILDQLGLAYPDPNWTYADAARIWQAATGQNQDGTHRAGASFYWHSEALPFWLAGWGAQYMNAAQDRATMASAEGGAAVSYVEDLFKAGAAIDGEQNPLLLPRAQAVFAQYHSAHVINIGVGNLGNRYKWDLLPNPVWPRGRTTFVTIDCYMLNARTKHQSEAWTLLKWISGAEGDLAWPKFQIQISLVTPSLISLWDYWEKTIVQVAPVLEGKALHWFYDAAKNGYDYPQLFFRYNPLSADALVNTWLGDIGAGKVGVRLGLQQMQNQVNALEQTATPPLSLQQTIAAERKALQGMQAMFAGARNG